MNTSNFKITRHAFEGTEYAFLENRTALPGKVFLTDNSETLFSWMKNGLVADDKLIKKLREEASFAYANYSSSGELFILETEDEYNFAKDELCHLIEKFNRICSKELERQQTTKPIPVQLDMWS